jgi:hypothetical protein
MKQYHLVEIFSANCPLCKHIIDDIQIGKCEGCNQIVYDINNITDEIKLKLKDYSVKAVPTTIIDGKINPIIMHIHPQLSILVNGTSFSVPAQIGIDPSLWKDHSRQIWYAVNARNEYVSYGSFTYP